MEFREERPVSPHSSARCGRLLVALPPRHRVSGSSLLSRRALLRRPVVWGKSHTERVGAASRMSDSMRELPRREKTRSICFAHRPGGAHWKEAAQRIRGPCMHRIPRGDQAGMSGERLGSSPTA
uniref:Uncharacterized protein n=1 Tax=Knipowitschia caucasica TaxID=637954 RepID=A0AAV2M2R4_KNICA